MKIIKNESLALHTTYKIGGSADLFIEALSQEELIEALRYAQQNQLPFILIGGGSNLLFSDRGIRGLAIKNSASKISVNGTIIFAESGASIGNILKMACEKSLSGLEFLSGIPGSLGGAIYGNAGAFGIGIGDRLKSIRIFDGKETIEITPQEADFSYRNSLFKKNSHIILSAEIELIPGEKENIEKEVKQIIKSRKEKHPSEKEGSCGCFFKNVQEKGQARKTSAGKLIEEAGYKGLRHNNAYIFENHCNFILNGGDASAKDIIFIAKTVKEKVYEKSGLLLENEVQIIPEKPPFKSISI